MNNVCSLYEVTEESMVRAHKAGMAYWQRNRPRKAERSDLESLARSCGWHGADCYAWLAGFYGAMARDLAPVPHHTKDIG